MTSFPLSPRLMKGALVGLDIFNPLTSLIIFQYNPETMTRTLQAQTLGSGEGDRTEALRLKGAPIENISLAIEIELDATDQFEKGDGIAATMGIYPQLSALEMLIYPKSALVIANTVLMALGTIECCRRPWCRSLFLCGAQDSMFSGRHPFRPARTVSFCLGWSRGSGSARKPISSARGEGRVLLIEGGLVLVAGSYEL